MIEFCQNITLIKSLLLNYKCMQLLVNSMFKLKKNQKILFIYYYVYGVLSKNEHII